MRVGLPLRVDLAGGTLDLPPIFAVLGGCCTCNVTISCYAWAEAQQSEHHDWTAEDLGLHWRGSNPEEAPEKLALFQELCRELGNYWRIRTHVEAPPGAGLGGSSALLCAMIAAATGWREPERIVRFSRFVETRILRMPAGYQDAVAAVTGGVLIIWFTAEGWQVERAPEGTRRLLEEELLVFYSGVAHFSAENNWRLVRAFVEADPEVVRLMEGLRENARGMAEALREGDAQGIAYWMERDGEMRRSAFPEMTTPLLDEAIRVARDNGARATRICGAGGGGALAVMVPKECRNAVKEALTELGLTEIPLREVGSRPKWNG